MKDELKFRPGVDHSVPQLFVFKMPASSSRGRIVHTTDLVFKALKDFNPGHRILTLSSETDLQVLGDVTLEELGLQKIPDNDLTEEERTS